MSKELDPSKRSMGDKVLFSAIPFFSISALIGITIYDYKTSNEKPSAEQAQNKARVTCEGMAKYIINLSDKLVSNDSPLGIIGSKLPQVNPSDPSPEQIAPFVTVLSKISKDDLGSVIPLSAVMPSPNDGDEVFVPLKCEYIK